MSRFANEKTLEYIEMLKSQEKALRYIEILRSQRQDWVDNPMYKCIYENIMGNIESNEDNYEKIYELIFKYKSEIESREGIDLAFLAFTGYPLGSILEMSIEEHFSRT